MVCTRGQVDDDTFVRLPLLTAELLRMKDDRLYWGYFDGRAPVRKKGKWAEKVRLRCLASVPTSCPSGQPKLGLRGSHQRPHCRTHRAALDVVRHLSSLRNGRRLRHLRPFGAVCRAKPSAALSVQRRGELPPRFTAISPSPTAVPCPPSLAPLTHPCPRACRTSPSEHGWRL